MFDRIRRGVHRHGITLGAVRLLDHWLNPRGISPLNLIGRGFDPGPDGETTADRFNEIAVQDRWGSAESISGPGSEIAYTTRYASALTSFLKEYAPASLFDAPCGDLNWVRRVLGEVDLEYFGGDISTAVIELNQRRHPDINCAVFDITSDPFPSAEVWHCRDCMFHLSYADIAKALENFLRSNCQYALLTSHGGFVRNRDIRTGGWRYLNLRRRPFLFGPPERKLMDYRRGIDFPRYVGAWHRNEIRGYLDRLVARWP